MSYVRVSDICIGRKIYVAHSAISNKRLNRNTCDILTMINRSLDEFRKHLNFHPDIAFRVAPIKSRNITGRCCDSGKLIEIDCRSRWDKALETLAHELVHAEQYYEGRLKKTFDSYKGWHHQWHGNANTSKGTTYNAYRNQPWEKEAWERQADLAEKVCSALEKQYGE